MVMMMMLVVAMFMMVVAMMMMMMMIKVQVGRSIESGGVESKQSLCMHTIGIGVFDHDDDDDNDDDVDDYDGDGDGDGQNFTLKNSSLNGLNQNFHKKIFHSKSFIAMISRFLYGWKIISRLISNSFQLCALLKH